MVLTDKEKQKMQKAKVAAQSGKYRSALILLEGIEHPTANKWRHQLKMRIEQSRLGDIFGDEGNKPVQATRQTREERVALRKKTTKLEQRIKRTESAKWQAILVVFIFPL